MKTFRMAALGLLLLCFITSCKPAREKSNIVKFSSKQPLALINYANVEVSGICRPNGAFAAYQTGPSLFLVMLNNESGEDSQFVYMYLPEDGRQVDLRIDGNLLYVNGIARSISVTHTNSPNFATWYASADDSAIQALRSIDSDGAFETEIMTLHEKNPRIAFTSGGDPLSEVPPPYSPCFLIVDADHDFNPAAIEPMDLTTTRLLLLCGTNQSAMASLASKDMPELSRMILSATPAAEQVLKAFPQVKALGFMEGDSVPSLAAMKNLEELHFVLDNDKASVDLNVLPNPALLRILTVPHYQDARGVDKLVNLEYLNPGKQQFSDETLAVLVAAHPNLRFLDLLPASVQSMEPLRQAKHLEGIELCQSMNDTVPDFAPLGGLKHLRYVGLPGKLAENPEVTDAIKKLCPQCVIYCHDTFCLGSGWLALFLPLLIAVLVYKIRKQARVRP